MARTRGNKKERKDRAFQKFSNAPLRARLNKKPYAFQQFKSKRRKNGKEEGVLGMDILRGVYSLAQWQQCNIESPIFRLHGNATVILLVTFSIAVTTRQYVGNPIDCVHTKDIPEDVLNTFCWIHSTFIVMDSTKDIPVLSLQGNYPGVQDSANHPIKQVKYYQWIAFVLFLQASVAPQGVYGIRTFGDVFRKKIPAEDTLQCKSVEQLPLDQLKENPVKEKINKTSTEDQNKLNTVDKIIIDTECAMSDSSDDIPLSEMKKCSVKQQDKSEEDLVLGQVNKTFVHYLID